MMRVAITTVLTEQLIYVLEQMYEVHRYDYSDLVQQLKVSLSCAQLHDVEPRCPDCDAHVLYECVACSATNYPKKDYTYSDIISDGGMDPRN